MKLLLPLLFSISLSAATLKNSLLYHTEDSLEKVIPALLYQESRGRHFGKNGKVIKNGTAIGRWQVTPQCVGWFNMQTRSRLLLRDVENERINEVVGRWYLYFCFVQSGGSIVMAVNNYHQGHNSDPKRLFSSYLKKVCPEDFKRFMVGKVILKTETKGSREWIEWAAWE